LLNQYVAMNDELPLPDVNDKLFKDFNKDFRHNAIVSSGIKKFFLFSEGYKTAAIKLSEQLDGSAFYANYLVYPLIFLNRHFLELRLKELISGVNFIVNHEYEFPNGHNLNSLWNTYRAKISEAGEIETPDKKILDNIGRLINEFNFIDPKSFSFRYPVDTAQDRKPSLKITNIDLYNFVSTMKKLYNFFDWQSDYIFRMIDLTEEFIDILRSEYESEMQSYYDYY